MMARARSAPSIMARLALSGRCAAGRTSQIDAVVDAGHELALAGMSDDEVKTLIDLLQRLIVNLERAAEREAAATDRSGER